MSIDSLKEQRKSKQRSFDTYANRRNAIRKIIDNMDKKLDDDVRDINGQIHNCQLELTAGLKGVNNNITKEMEKVKEPLAANDLKLSDCRNNLSSEISRCQRRINALDSEIKQLEAQIKAEGGKIYFWE